MRVIASKSASIPASIAIFVNSQRFHNLIIMTSGRDSEQAPLLADDARDDEADSIEDAPQADSKVPKREKPRIWLRKSWDWLLNNLMTTAIILLLLGGLIALLVYFVGMFEYFQHQIQLKSQS